MPCEPDRGGTVARGARSERQPDHELGTLALRRRCCATTAPPCIATSDADEREPDADPALRAVQRAPGLHEQLEDRLEHALGDPGAVVAHADDGVPVLVGQRRGATWPPRGVYFAALLAG